MSRVAILALVVSVLVPASAGAGTARPPLALTASPGRLALFGAGEGTIRVTNPGLSPVVVDVSRAGFTLDLRGRPRIASRAGRNAAVSWVRARPGRFVLRAGAARSVTVSSRPPMSAEPGDHDALVLLTTRPLRGAGVAVRMRIGVIVVVRAPGPIIRRVALGGVRVLRSSRARTLELGLANRGNVTETIDGTRLRVWAARGSARTRLRAEVRDLRPRTSGVVQVPYRSRIRGWTTVRVELLGEPGRPPVIQTFRVKL
jgi:hypothetical protein